MTGVPRLRQHLLCGRRCEHRVLRGTARRDSPLDDRRLEVAQHRLALRAADRRQVQDVLGRRRIRPLAQIEHRRLHPERLGQVQDLPHVRRYVAEQFQARPRASLDRKPHHVRHARQQLDSHDCSPQSACAGTTPIRAGTQDKPLI
ncbi:MAG TPA: hypothetical protein VKG78_06440 [Opitutaceae bacterium]|nr:hypothetical protein [Opitutaceae bacterium]